MPSLIYQGKVSSITSTSLENLDNIRPEGVVSKNLRGKRKTLRNNCLCKTAAATTQPSSGTNCRNTEKVAETNNTTL